MSPSHGVRLTWRQLADQVDALAAGFVALGLERGDRIGIWSLNRPEWTLTQFAAAKAGLILVTINPAYRLRELEYALTKVGCKACWSPPPQFKTPATTSRWSRTLAPETRQVRTPGQTGSREVVRDLRAVIQIGGPKAPGTIAFEDVATTGRDRHRSRSLRSPGDPAVRRSDQHPVHQRHHGLPEGRHAHAPQHPQQRLLRRPRHGAAQGRPPVHPGAALPLLRHGHGQSGLR